MVAELGLPVRALALTGGPSQPEFQGFEPVGTTDLVNPFSGDFTYNVPLLDVEGYPVNMAYHSGVGVEQEASWVGLGWSLNTGAINRGIRGLPDDFNGETLRKTIEINDEQNDHVSVQLGGEFLGFGGSQNFGINHSNYTGVSASYGIDVSLRVGNDFNGMRLSQGVSFTTDRGVDLNANVGAYASSIGKISAGVNGNFGVGLNSREGLKYTSFGVNPSLSTNKVNSDGYLEGTGRVRKIPGVSNTYIPIGIQNFVPTISSSYSIASEMYRIRIGASALGAYMYGGGTLSRNTTRFERDATRQGYGYNNLQNADVNSVTDFTRDRDGRFNPDMAYLAAGTMTYDVLAISGQGTAGMYRAFRNDIGTVSDPATGTRNEANSKSVEAGYGNLFEVGYDQSDAYSHGTSGGWKEFKKPFTRAQKGSLYEPVHFKQAGDLAQSRTAYHQAILNQKSLNRAEVNDLKNNPIEQLPDETQKRAKRSALLYGFTGTEASLQGVSNMPVLKSYPYSGNFDGITPIPRTGTGRPGHHTSEYHQLLPDGRRYVYGLPAMNNTQVEYTTSCLPPAPGETPGQVNIGAQGRKPYGTASTRDFGQDLYMKSVLPPHAHSYLLTEILSEDYADLTGDGLTPDDIGNYTKFNYTRTTANYNWRTPYENGKASYDPGVSSDCHDDKASFVCGEKEIWVLHSIETKNQIAFFYSSARQDSKGADDQFPNQLPLPETELEGNYGDAAEQSANRKLDRIKLFNRAEWTADPDNAVPIKTVHFYYDYTLCPNTPSSDATGKGKLTLRAIAMQYGKSEIGLLNPYKFKYNSPNPSYSFLGRDRWGTYKAPGDNGHPSVNVSLDNNQFPFTPQDETLANQNAAAWNLTDIELPSGGQIHVDYEADDYAYVQGERAMEMVPLAGLGSSPKFRPGNTLYQSGTDPNLFLYFKRKKKGTGYDEQYDALYKSYLDQKDVLQYNFRVQIDGGNRQLPSCNGTTPLEDQIKGYGKVKRVGTCDNPEYGYVELEPKTVRSMPMLGDASSNLRLHPATLATIFYARLYNNKALDPGSEILSYNVKDILTQLLYSIGGLLDYLRDPIAKYLNQGKAKRVNLSQSWVRLCSQGKKKGGGHRVRRIEFRDQWQKISDPGQNDAVYGSEYDYTTTDEQGKTISSGVATYEPLIGGDENPFKMPASVDKINQGSDFPAVTPTEITNEGPMGETLYPPGQIGYSKMTIRSIHKAEGQSSQTVQTHEFYTAKDFPILREESPIQKRHDKPSPTADDKRELFEGSQGYTFTFNDMHGKPKKEAVWVSKGGDLQEVSHKIYRYGTNGTRLDNRVTCVDPVTLDEAPNVILGEEMDLMIDSRYRDERSSNDGFMANLNGFAIPPIPFPIPVPTVFPEIPKSDQKKFQSMVATKIVQQYGILKEVETFDKGATVTISNEIYDLATGQPIVTKVSTEHKDFEYQVKYPAYWAYKGMGAAYENIGYEEDLEGGIVRNDTLYLDPKSYDNFKIGDEAIVDIKSCKSGTTRGKYKVWILDKTNSMPSLDVPVCDCPPNTNQAIVYSVANECGNHLHNARRDFLSLPAGIEPKNYFGDNVCNIPWSSISYYDGNVWEGESSTIFLNANSRINQLIPHLYDILWGTAPMPIETIDVRSLCRGNGNGYISKNVIADKISLELFLNNDIGSKHVGIDDPTNITPTGVNRGSRIYRGQIGRRDLYNIKYNNYPILGTSKKLLKISVDWKSDSKYYLKNTNTGDSVEWFRYSDHKEKWGDPENPYSHTITDYYIPFNQFITASMINDLKVSEKMLVARNPVGTNSLYPIHFLGNNNAGFNIYTLASPPQDILKDGKLYNSVVCWEKQYISSDAQVVDRTTNFSVNNTLVAVLQKTGAGALEDPHQVLNSNDQIASGTIKVIRSGNRNQLLESVQDVSIASKEPFHYKGGTNSLSLGDVIRIQARTYSDTAAGSFATTNEDAEYYNPFVTGQRGTFRPRATWEYTGTRNYDAAKADVVKGLLGTVPSFWQFSTLISSPFVGALMPVVSQGWFARETIRSYSPYGQPLEVTDAAGNEAASLYGYDNTLPIATIQNAKWNGALYENFEDSRAINQRLQFYQNPLSQVILTTPSITRIADPHTGRYGVNLATTLNLALPAMAQPPVDYPTTAIHPFFFRPGQRYLLNYWQKMDLNSTSVGLPGRISLSGSGLSVTTKAKTPVLDGWVLYEAQFTVPQTVTGNALNLTALSGTFDDLRILPTDANMKCYVYHPENRRVMASLDENHMASFFEYDAEGKLTRVKKETDRGILTIKESRQSVRAIKPTTGTAGSGNVYH